jgi:electron transport complex protein RnfE
MMKTATSRSEWLAIMLCPAIALSDWTVNALGLAASSVLAGSVALLSRMLMQRLPLDARWPISVMLLVALMSGLTLAIDAWWHPLHAALHVFVLLFAANLAIHSESASNDASILQGARAGAGIVIALMLLGIAREAVGHGSIFHGAADVFAWLDALQVQLFRTDRGFLLAMLPPGAFIATGLLLAARNWLDLRLHERA